ncbi:MAG: hypothetical protein ACYCU7_12835 [Acidimicrobiales bacterium]
MTDGFDAELFLRLAGERLLLDRSDGDRGPFRAVPLQEMAAALVAVGVLDEERATEVLVEYAEALHLRGGSGLPPGVANRRPAPARRTAGLAAATVWACDDVLELAGGRLHVHCVALREDGGSVLVSFTPAGGAFPGGPRPLVGPPRPVGGPLGGHPMAALHQLTVGDDRGHTVTATFSGGGSPAGWRGQLHTPPGQSLSPTTRWLEFGGERVVLGEPATPPGVTVERLDDAGPAERFLRARLTSGRHGPHGGPYPQMIDAAVEALVAAGALAADSPLIEQVRDVVAAFSGQPATRPLPDRWQSLISSLPRQGSRSFVAPVGVVTPALSETVVAVDSLLAGDGVLESQVRMSGPGAQVGPWGIGLTIGRHPLSWWAHDDLANHYLGAPGNWSGGPDRSEGTVTYWPPLDDRATTVTLAPTAADVRALIPVRLPAESGR